MFEMLSNSNKKWIATTNGNSANIWLSKAFEWKGINETRRRLDKANYTNKVDKSQNEANKVENIVDLPMNIVRKWNISVVSQCHQRQSRPISLAMDLDLAKKKTFRQWGFALSYYTSIHKTNHCIWDIIL